MNHADIKKFYYDLYEELVISTMPLTEIEQEVLRRDIVTSVQRICGAESELVELALGFREFTLNRLRIAKEQGH